MRRTHVELHARGVTVEVRGRCEGRIVVVEVRGDGPGVPVGAAAAVPARTPSRSEDPPPSARSA